MKPVIGIISYLPDDSFVRQSRFKLFKDLINTCKMLFNLPIYVVIQNYTEDELHYLRSNNIQLSCNFSKLGILEARRELRKWFLESEYDYLIMLDDDCLLDGKPDDGKEYLRQLKENEGKFGEFNLTLLKLFSIPKVLLQEVDYPSVHPELGEGFEDRVFVEILRNKFPDKRFTYHTNIQEFSISTNDYLSTWYKDQDLNKMRDNTKILIENINK